MMASGEIWKKLNDIMLVVVALHKHKDYPLSYDEPA